MLFSSDYSVKIPIGQALAVSLIGIVTVILILAAIACLILLVSKIIRAIEKKGADTAEKPSPSTAPQGIPMPESMTQGEIELIGTDEKTAAVIMAIVSEKSGIPLNRLNFKSIKLLNGEKGDKAND